MFQRGYGLKPVRSPLAALAGQDQVLKPGIGQDRASRHVLVAPSANAAHGHVCLLIGLSCGVEHCFVANRLFVSRCVHLVLDAFAS